MANIKSIYSIKDLENLSGVKAHTIRIWERRYHLLAPMRTENNIRYYDTHNFQKLLNVVVLLRYGFKISKLSKLTEAELQARVNEIRSHKYDRDHVAHQFKLAMMTFDQQLFMETYDSLVPDRSFREIFFDYFLPLFDDIGVLWQTKTITPAHEHFISYLVRLKILANTNACMANPASPSGQVYALFLPHGEIHELGLLYLNYELVLRGHHTIYLGENLPVDTLEGFKTLFDQVTYISYTTVAPSPDALDDFINEMTTRVLTPNDAFWLVGGRLSDKTSPAPHIQFFGSLRQVVENLPS
ncbi:MAG TPA: MerR family transcriptional regulator [Flavobacterium sp.]|nr:MerR family transcriptional regulator [Flavobacterium sp.]